MSWSQKHFESHFYLEHIKPKMHADMENIPIYIQTLQSPSPNLNNKEPSEEEIKFLKN